MKKKTLATLFLPVLAAAMLLGACATPAPAAQAEINLVDGLERTVALDAPAQKIVTLSPPLTEILYAIGAGDQVIGRDSFSDYPEAALALPDIGGGYSEYDLETILSLEPDLVITGSINTPELVQSLQDLGLTVYYLGNPSDLDGTLAAIQTLGQLSGRADEAQTLVDALSARIAAVDEALAGTSDIPSVYYELDASDPAKPYTPGPGTYYSNLIARAGGQNVGDAMEAEWAQISLENLLVADPHYIVLGDANWGVTPESLNERAGWEALTAVKQGNIIPFDDDLLARFGPRQVDGLEALAKLLHPDLFE
ncbi:ABC transporter substrate-binding protein [Pelolinea submarina]|uniref:Iron complex transport system substrate-binding protein n=1 Tax=Pelolinea submarina TaxID=913107 RepID=A0A347ZNJ7_9CHLR|nr:helical backbone metal receptor [Pelolinea submarina]REG08481.1 iron complex transport system substrate-binding protein [Pelolinea submarina]BBB46878.1 iron complex transport system substrate-binding protein [Pelolinea submarina]